LNRKEPKGHNEGLATFGVFAFIVGSSCSPLRRAIPSRKQGTIMVSENVARITVRDAVEADVPALTAIKGAQPLLVEKIQLLFPLRDYSA
jgi:hypothetical protein